mmetsp:Transcript_20955/g.39275  ORF Transcript_20955/g.39275 Transcript_20955/m.39275 type:complete len:112 (-) Transcript_20955:233-568(-)
MMSWWARTARSRPFTRWKISVNAQPAYILGDAQQQNEHGILAGPVQFPNVIESVDGRTEAGPKELVGVGEAAADAEDISHYELTSERARVVSTDSFAIHSSTLLDLVVNHS